MTSNEQPTIIPFPITIHYPPAVYKHSDLPRQGLAAIPCRFHQRCFHKRCNSCTMACATSILLLVKLEDWLGFPGRGQGPALEKHAVEPCPIKADTGACFMELRPVRRHSFFPLVVFKGGVRGLCGEVKGGVLWTRVLVWLRGMVTSSGCEGPVLFTVAEEPVCSRWLLRGVIG